MLTFWFVFNCDVVYVFPENSVPAVDVLNRPMFWSVTAAVTNESDDANACVNCSVFDAEIEGETVLRCVLDMISPSSAVAVAPGAVPVPRATWLIVLLPAEPARSLHR